MGRVFEVIFLRWRGGTGNRSGQQLAWGSIDNRPLDRRRDTSDDRADARGRTTSASPRLGRAFGRMRCRGAAQLIVSTVRSVISHEVSTAATRNSFTMRRTSDQYGACVLRGEQAPADVVDEYPSVYVGR